jgi:signal peptidase I
MENLVQFFVNIHDSLHASIGDSLYLLIVLLAFISIVAQWMLYEKANQPGIASIVPIWNVIVFLRIVGRPANHIFLFFIPIYGQLYLIPKVYIELCNSFGKRSIVDYVLVIVFNGFYILNLGLSYDTQYEGPVYSNDNATAKPASALAA